MSFAPAELIVIQGDPRYLLVDGTTDLLWVSDTEADVFRMGKAGAVYYLVAGRWFSAPGFTGPWKFATPSLPADFQKIPLEHPRSRVLASVPGTQQAAEAVLLAQVPQTARVNRKEVKAPDVTYQGAPKFEPVPTTKVEYAVNTDKDIVKFGDLYYLCFQGVWFMSKKPDGPWEVCSKVPKEIYAIPASSPVNNVTYVTVVEEDTNDEWVTFAAVAAYTGVMIAWGCAWWGTGYYHPPYWGWGGGYPYYYPRYPTYGYGAWYNPWTGGYGRAAVAYGPYGGAGVGARYNPTTGTYARGAVAYGPYGARGAAEAYNPRTGTYGQTRQGSGVYGSWGSTAVQRGDDWAKTSRVTNDRTGNTTRVTQGSGGGGAVTRNTPGPGGGGVAKTGSGDVYAGRDGNVYKNDGGGWQKYDGSSWNNVEKPQGQAGATARDQAAATGGDRSTVDQTEPRPGGAHRGDAAHQRPGLHPQQRHGQQPGRQLPPERRRPDGWRRRRTAVDTRSRDVPAAVTELSYSDVIATETSRPRTIQGAAMSKRHTRVFVVAVLALASAMAAHGLAQGQQPPKVQIPQSGVPQIMTLEGAFVRAAYNNEGYVILGYRLANSSVGQPWMLLDVGMTLRERVPNYKLTRAALSLETPDGKTVPLPSNEEFQSANLAALERQSQVTNDSINYFPPMASQACRIGFFAELAQRARSYDEVELSPTRACLGKVFFPIPGGITYGQYWLNVKFEKSLVRVPLRI